MIIGTSLAQKDIHFVGDSKIFWLIDACFEFFGVFNKKIIGCWSAPLRDAFKALLKIHVGALLWKS